MNIIEFKKNAKRTLPDKGTQLLDSIHMVLGIYSEVFEELGYAVEKQDKINIAEELADTQWYAVNYCNIWDIQLPSEIIIDTTVDEVEYFVSFGKIADLDKKLLAYGKEVNLQQRIDCILNILYFTECVAKHHSIDMDLARTNNIAKLKLRFPDKFTEENAINRDLEKEREILERTNETATESK